MKYPYLITLFFLCVNISFAQFKDRIRGSKNVIEKTKDVGEFTSLEIEDNLTVFLEKAEKNEIVIEGDDNLHDNITLDLREKSLRIYTAKEITNFKKLVLKVKYTKDLNTVIAKNAATINALESVMLDSVSFTAKDFSKLYMNVSCKKFNLFADDKSKTEMNLKSETTKLQFSKNAQIKALVAATDLELELTDKATALLEGDIVNAVVKQNHNSVFTGTNLSIKNADLTTKGLAISNILAGSTLILDADNTSKIYLLGQPKIEVRKFTGEAQLIKKSK